MTVQVIKQGDKPEWAVVPYQEYDSVKMALEEGKEELLPETLVNALLEGAHPVKVWCKYRGLTQKALAEAACISVPYLSQLESGKREGSLEVLSAIAAKLGVTLDDIG